MVNQFDMSGLTKNVYWQCGICIEQKIDQSESVYAQINNPRIPKPQKENHMGPKISKITPNISQDQMSELKETQKIKVFAHTEQNPK